MAFVTGPYHTYWPFSMPARPISIRLHFSGVENCLPHTRLGVCSLATGCKRSLDSRGEDA